MIKNITVREIEYIAEKLAQEFFLINEYVADISSRPADVLEHCLSEAFQAIEKKFIYPDLLSRAGIFFYLMIKKSPFECCNKRIAVTTLLAFLFANNKWLMVDPRKLLR
ncbi:MAG TPA: hypothetical protein ENG75_03020, partial [Nitrospirae bacterium]|nr:hypothetical protein [Nitrospirota bacterium]